MARPTVKIFKTANMRNSFCYNSLKLFIYRQISLCLTENQNNIYIYINIYLNLVSFDLTVLISSFFLHLFFRQWATLYLEPLSKKNVKELLRAELALFDIRLSMEDEAKILDHCQMEETCVPLFIMVLARHIVW